MINSPDKIPNSFISLTFYLCFLLFLSFFFSNLKITPEPFSFFFTLLSPSNKTLMFKLCILTRVGKFWKVSCYYNLTLVFPLTMSHRAEAIYFFFVLFGKFSFFLFHFDLNLNAFFVRCLDRISHIWLLKFTIHNSHHSRSLINLMWF